MDNEETIGGLAMRAHGLRHRPDRLAAARPTAMKKSYVAVRRTSRERGRASPAGAAVSGLPHTSHGANESAVSAR
jgi:hypothetical protein